MASPFVAEIRIFPFNFAPKGWAMCNGQILPLSQNTALFSLLGTTYGGDGKSTFALPNLQGISPMQAGQGPGLSLRDLGEVGGEETVTLITTELPQHSHFFNADANNATTSNPSGGAYAQGTWVAAPNSGNVNIYTTAAPDTPLASNALAPTGGNLPHNNLMPYLTLNFCIALQGVFPPRS
jgi:microcystin-dependent protein